jgi:hypothetical protein
VSAPTWGNLARAITRAGMFANSRRVLIFHPDDTELVEATRREVANSSRMFPTASEMVEPGHVMLVNSEPTAYAPVLVIVEPDGCGTEGMWGSCRLPRGHGGEPKTCDCPPMPHPFED